MTANCLHEQSLYGRCVLCGRTWEEQAEDRARALDDRHPNKLAVVAADLERERYDPEGLTAERFGGGRR